MGIAFLHGNGGSGGSGGSELTIVGGTTRPAKATQNTIWIATDVKITDYALSAIEPENPVEGMVWITISNFGAVKVPSPAGGDWITVYPLAAKQLIDGVWVEKVSSIYQNGEWMEILPWTYLYSNGNEFTDITGGWVASSYASGQRWDYYASDAVRSIQKNADHMYIYAKNANPNNSASASVYTKNKINLTPYSILQVKFEEITNVVSVYGYPGSAPFEYYSGAVFSASGNSSKLEVEIDISSVAQPVHILIGGIAWLSSGSDVRMARIKEVRVK